MAINPDDYSPVAAGYATPEQQKAARDLAMSMMQPKSGTFMQSWTQPIAQMAQTLLGTRLMQQANQRDYALMTGGRPEGDTGGDDGKRGLGGEAPVAGDLGGGLTRIVSKGGVPFTVSSTYADRFKGLVDDLEDANYPLKGDQSGGYNNRYIAGTHIPSQHAFGRAIDVNWDDNPRGGKSNIPPDLARSLASKWGLTWGGDWRKPDPMHFEVNLRSNPTATASAGNIQNDATKGLPPPQNGPPAPGTPPVPASGQSPPPSAPPQAVAQGPQPPNTTPQGPAMPQPYLKAPQVTWDQVVAARYRGDTKRADELEDAYTRQVQGLPVTQDYGKTGWTLSYIPGRPDLPPQWIPPKAEIKEQEFAGNRTPIALQPTPEGGVRRMPITSGQPPAAGPPAAGPPGSSAPPGKSELGFGPGGEVPDNPEDLTKLGINITGAKKMAEESATGQAKTYDKIYTGLTGYAMIAAQQKQNINALRQIAQDPDLWTGSGANSALALQRLAAQLGVNTKGAAPREVFNMLQARILADQFAGLKTTSDQTGETGSRIFKQFLDIEEKANITSEDSQQGVLAKLNMLDRAGDLGMHYADMADDYIKENGRLDAGFNKKIRAEIAKGRIMPEGETVTGGKLPQHSPADVEAEMRRRGLIK